MSNTITTYSRIAWLSSLLLILTFVISACQPAPAPAKLTSSPTKPAESTATAELVATEAASPTPEPTADLAPQLLDKLWVLVAMGEAANPAVVEEGTVVTALFSSDGSLSGSGGCNNYNTGYELMGDQLTVDSPIASTMMFCEGGMEQESAYLAALQSAGRIAFTSEGRLEIFYDVGSVTQRKMV